MIMSQVGSQLGRPFHPQASALLTGGEILSFVMPPPNVGVATTTTNASRGRTGPGFGPVS
jgi:hypothetical protein